MALGGGTFTNYNKVLPGTYINFISASNVSGEVSDRGVCAVGVNLSWGKEGEFFSVTAEDFFTNSVKYFGYSATDEKLMHMNDLFKNASLVHVYRLGSGIKAANDYAYAKYTGVCGNLITIKINENIDDDTLFDVTTYYKSAKKDTQTVKSMAELVDNDFVIWNKSATLSQAGSLSLTGGSDATVTGEDYQAFLDAAESVSFNILAVASEDSNVNNLVASYTKRMREERGVKFQSVLYRCEADHMGVINVHTSVKDTVLGKSALVWYVAGAAAACEVNKSLLNHVYQGNFTPNEIYTQAELEEGIKKGRFIMHSVDNEYRVLADINSLVNTTSETGDVFKENQTVRVIDQIAYDDANLFKSKYLGAVPNDDAGRISLWNDIVEHRKNLEKMRAIENFTDEDVQVEKGDKKTSVVITSKICPVNSMAQLYITTMIE